MPEFPIQLSKVQSPPLREQTLARDRLLDWLAAKIHDRVVLVIAEAGYGKTTLLADFSRRTRLRTLWYRLDRGDRDWVGFIAHLAAAARVHIPDFGMGTAGLLRETATTAPSLDVVLDTFVRELGELPPDATVLVLDDFHLVDDNPDIRHVVRELLARAPERLTFVFASRRVPPVPLARLRALGEVAELGTDDLRFDEAETGRLFRETYEMPLERGLISELSSRTEGWAASLQLVRAALHDRDAVQARAFIGSLSGAEGHLYDYLAEEVIGDLPPALQDFLMRTSILETIDVDLAAVAAGVTRDQATSLVADIERLGLLSRRSGSRIATRMHPLVTEFLRTRLLTSVGLPAVQAIHRAVAESAIGHGWRTSGYHYLAAGDQAQAQQVVASSLNEILATGAYASAEALLGIGDDVWASPAALILASRLAIVDADSERALALAERAHSVDPGSPAAALTLIAARQFAGDVAGAMTAGDELERSQHPRFARLARAARAILETSIAGSIRDALASTEELLAALGQGEDHFRGIAELARAYLFIPAGAPNAALDAAEQAAEHLHETSAGMEMVSAWLARVCALALLGRLDEARAAAAQIERVAPRRQRLEVAMEVAWSEVIAGDEDRAATLMAEAAGEPSASADTGIQAVLVNAELAIRRQDHAAALAHLGHVPERVITTLPGFEARRLIAAAHVSRLAGDLVAARRHAEEARELATNQGAKLWADVAALICAALTDTAELNRLIVRSQATVPWALGIAAEWIAPLFGVLSRDALGALTENAVSRSDRWRATVRRTLAAQETAGGVEAAASLLSVIGVADDLPRLRALEKSQRMRGPGHSRALARRLAPRVLVEDLGRVRILVGDRAVEGTQVRRKVLALLCFLLSREGFSSTRDEVLDSLWPDLDPASALNSLNQTVYFLRRVFEPSYRDDQTPGYLHQDGETIWLDSELVDARSRQARELIRALTRQWDGAGALRLSELYEGRFALDFAYEEWVTNFRDSLHAAFLRVVEQSIRQDMNDGRFNRAIEVAERAALIETESEEFQAALVRLYRLAGAYAAAAEQYGRYASNLRGIGVDPPSFDVVAAGSGSIGTPAY